MEGDTHHRYLSFPTHMKNVSLNDAIGKVTVREKRAIFQLLRKRPDEHEAFLPHYGFTAATFCTWQILAEKDKRIRNR